MAFKTPKTSGLTVRTKELLKNYLRGASGLMNLQTLMLAAVHIHRMHTLCNTHTDSEHVILPPSYRERSCRECLDMHSTAVAVCPPLFSCHLGKRSIVH